MKSGLLLVGIALLLGGLVGTLVVRDPGYVLISYADRALETSLWFAVVVLILTYYLIRLVSWLFRKAAGSGGSLGSWLKGRKDRSARQQTQRGLLALARGEWAGARKLLQNAAPQAEAPLINYLAAARAAQQNGDLEGRDELLRLASTSTSDARGAVGLTQAELQQAAGQWEACLATLLKLREELPRHPQLLRMLLDCYRELGDWQAIIELLPDLGKQKILPDAELSELRVQGWVHSFDNTQRGADEIWNDVPKELKREPRVVSAYCHAEAGRGDAARAVAALQGALQHSFSEELVRLYGQLKGDSPGEQLRVAEGWLKERPHDAELLLALGRIAMMNQEWAKAREYFEASLRLGHSTAVYAELGRLCAALGDLERGSEYLLLAQPDLPELPLPPRR